MNIHEETLKIARNLIKKDPSLTDWVASQGDRPLPARLLHLSAYPQGLCLRIPYPWLS